MTQFWKSIPAELQARRQWLLAAPDKNGNLKIPTSVDYNGKLIPGSVTDAGTWLAFADAASAGAHYGLGIGYVLAKDDPFACIDLDVKNKHNEPDPDKWTAQVVIERHAKILETFNSYSEQSQSGQGLHIWVKGKIGKGARRDSVEVYSQERFIVCTGRGLGGAHGIEERELLLSALVKEMRAASVDEAVDLVDIAELHSDSDIVDMLTNAVNGDKFLELCLGDWKGMGYPSQSEADLALLSMFTFHSRNNAQCIRLFRMTALGKRDKAVKNDVYLKRTLRIIRGRQQREDAAVAHGAALANSLMKPLTASPTPTQSAPPAPTTPLKPHKSFRDPLPLPPGFAGTLAQYIFDSSVRPVREVAIVGALGLLAGVCGKAWNIPQSGLNLYITLVARSAIGKESMHSGISKIVNQVLSHGGGGVNITRFIDFMDFASGPALSKAVAVEPSFVNISGEWGRKMKRMSEDGGRDSAMVSLRTLMTNLYQKSSATSIVGGIGYSDKEKTVGSVRGVAYSMIGETTPSTFYESLTDSMMEDGFLSRFIIIEYDGDRPAANRNAEVLMTTDQLDHLCALVVQASQINSRSEVVYVGLNPEAAEILDKFDLECDREINSTKDESWRQMWNRAHLKVCRVAALLCVADNPYHPIITPAYVEWALEVVRRDIGVMSARIAEGDVGLGDASREKKVMSSIVKYYSANLEPLGIPNEMRVAGIVPRKFLQNRLQRVSQFTSARGGATRALDDALRSLVDSGYIREVSKERLAEFGFSGRAFAILNIPKELLT